MKRGIILYIFFFIIKNGFAQELAIKRFTVHDGLVQMQVQEVFEDSRGYIWIGTKGGVSCFNGESFENFRTTDGLLSNDVASIDEDDFGNIWFYFRMGIAKYDGKKITPYAFPESWKLSRGRIKAGKEDNIYINRDDAPHLCHFNNSEFTILDSIAKGEKILKPLFYNKKDQAMVFFLENRLLFLNDSNDITSKKSLLPINNITSDNQLKTNTYTQWAPGDAWAERRLLQTDELLYEKNIYTHELRNVNYEVFTHDYYLVLAGSLKKIVPDKKQVKTISKINFSYARTLFTDSKGVFWITSDQGLIKWHGEGISNYTQKEFNYVWGFIEDIDGSLWIPRFNEGIFHFHNDTITEETGYLNTGLVNTKYFYFGSIIDKNGSLLFSHDKGVLKYDRKSFQLIKNNNINAPSISLILYEDRENDLILSGTKEGINAYKNYEHIGYWGKESDIHKCTYITNICKDTSGHYWLGSFYGLSRFNWKDKKAKNYTLRNGRLPSSGVMSSTLDNHGGLWFGGIDALMYFNYQKDSIVKLPISKIGDVSVIAQAKMNKLMVGASTGVYWIDLDSFYQKNKLKYYYMNQHNGFLGIEPTQSTYLNDSRGNTWLASSTVTTKFNPSKINFSTSPANTVIKSINDEKIKFDFLLTDSTLTLETDYLKIDFEAVGSNRTESIEYSYLLEGNSDKWSDWNTSTNISFSNLSSGNYFFSVKSRQKYTKEENKSARIAITINLPLHKEPYFPSLIITILFLSLFSSLSIGYMLFQRYRERSNTTKLLAQKNKNIETLHKELAHRVKNNLAFISSLMKMQGRRLNNPEAKEAIKEGKTRVDVMSLLHQKLFIQEYNPDINIREYLEELCANLQHTHPFTGARPQINLHIDDVFINSETGVRIGLIINELTTNSFKHAFLNQPKPLITINLYKEANDEINLSYKDNGTGVDKSINIHQTNSFGLKLIAMLAKQLGATLKITNNKGTKFHFKFKKP